MGRRAERQKVRLLITTRFRKKSSFSRAAFYSPPCLHHGAAALPPHQHLWGPLSPPGAFSSARKKARFTAVKRITQCQGAGNARLGGEQRREVKSCSVLPGVLHPGSLQRVQALLGGSPPAALEAMVLQKGFLCPSGTSSTVSLWKIIYPTEVKIRGVPRWFGFELSCAVGARAAGQTEGRRQGMKRM